MGTWHLEIFKMAIYMAFPVTSFYIYHQVDWFKDSVVEIQKKMTNRETLENQKELGDCIEMMRGQREHHFKDQLKKMQQES